MREAYVVADGEAVGLVCLSVHYKNSVMFLANDVKAHATLQRQNADGKRAYRSLMISYPSFRARFPNPDRHRPCRAYPALLRGPDEGGNKKIFRKEGQRSIPNRHGTRLAASVVGLCFACNSPGRASRGFFAEVITTLADRDALILRLCAPLQQ